MPLHLDILRRPATAAVKSAADRLDYLSGITISRSLVSTTKTAKQLRRSRGTGILADLVMIARQLGPALAGLIRTLRRVVHFAADRSFQHARIDVCRRRMPMGGRSAAGPILDEHDTQALAGHVRQLLIEDERDFRILADVLLSRDACGENCGGRGDEQRDLVHGASSFGWRMWIRLLPVSGRAIRLDSSSVK